MTEIKSVQAKLAKSTSKEDIDKIMKNLVSVEDQYFSKLDQKYDFEAFKSSIDNHLNNHLRRYLDIKTEVKRVQAKLAEATCKEDLDEIQKHLTDVEDQYFKKLGQKDKDFEVLKIRINKLLRQYLDKLDDKGVENSKLDLKDYFGVLKNSLDKVLCQYLGEISNINFPLVSDDIMVRKRLGCTEHCHWCGALCWGARDHQVGKDKMSEVGRHHSCHQPQGLKGTRYQWTEELLAVSCHNDPDSTGVWFEGKSISWGDAKRYHFRDWKFDVHCTTTFDEMMRWFFQELHEDIAKHRGLKAASSNKLKENKCANLNFEEILKVVHSKI